MPDEKKQPIVIKPESVKVAIRPENKELEGEEAKKPKS